MFRLLLSSILLSSLCHAQMDEASADKPIADDEAFIVAAYPWNPSYTKSEDTKLLQGPPSNHPDAQLSSPFISPNDQLFQFNIHFLDNPIIFSKRQVEWIAYNKTKQLVVAKATAEGHHALSHWLVDETEPNRYSLEFKIFFVNENTSLELTKSYTPTIKPDKSAVISLSGITEQSGEIPKLEKITEELSLKVVLLAEERFTDIYTNEFFFQLDFLDLNKRIFFDSKPWFDARQPMIMALGPHPGDSSKTIIAKIHIHPTTKDGHLMIEGRLCENFQDHDDIWLNYYQDYFQFQGTDEKPVYGLKVYDPDGLTVPRNPNHPDPFTAATDSLPLSEVSKAAVTSGMRNGKKMLDAEPYFKSRFGFPSFEADSEWIAYHEASSTLFFRLKTEEALFVETLVNGRGCSHILPLKHQITINSEKSSSALYSLPVRSGVPIEFHLYDNAKENTLAKIDINTTSNYDTGEIQTDTYLMSQQFEALKDGHSLEAKLIPGKTISFEKETTTIRLGSLTPEDYQITHDHEDPTEDISDPFQNLNTEDGE